MRFLLAIYVAFIFCLSLSFAVPGSLSVKINNLADYDRELTLNWFIEPARGGLPQNVTESCDEGESAKKVIVPKKNKEDSPGIATAKCTITKQGVIEEASYYTYATYSYKEGKAPNEKIHTFKSKKSSVHDFGNPFSGVKKQIGSLYESIFGKACSGCKPEEKCVDGKCTASECKNPKCTDFDATLGDETHRASSCTGSCEGGIPSSIDDKCIDKYTLNEAGCKEGKCSYSELRCPAGQVCSTDSRKYAFCVCSPRIICKDGKLVQMKPCKDDPSLCCEEGISIDCSNCLDCGKKYLEEDGSSLSCEQCKSCGHVRVLKYNDFNENGVMDSGETGLAGFKFSATSASGSQIFEMVSDKNGQALSDCIPAGTYDVTEADLPKSWEQTTPGSVTLEVKAGGITAEARFGNHQIPGDSNNTPKQNTQTCQNLQGICCTPDQTCTTPITGATDCKDTCCASCTPKQSTQTCKDLGGTCAQSYQTCVTKINGATDCKDTCCTYWQPAQTPEKTCKERNGRDCGSSSGLRISSPVTVKDCSATNQCYEDITGSILDLLQKKQRPLVGGLEIETKVTSGPYKGDNLACTSGAIVKGADGKNYILTASHCFESGTNGQVVQGGELVGAIYKRAEGIDAMLISINDGVSSEQKDYLGNSITGFGTAKEGLKVYKLGRTTGVTYGTITEFLRPADTSLNTKFKVCPDKDKNYKFSWGGDSGSAIISVETHEIIGLISACDDNLCCSSNMPEDIKSSLGI